MKNVLTKSLALMVVTAWLVVGPAALADAHVPAGSATCAGVVAHATDYDGSKANKWSITVGGDTQSGTFGASFDKTVAVPQGGATTAWSVHIEAFDGSYPGGGSGTVGPCGEAPPPPPVDVCPDIEGNQPEGTDCTPLVVPPVDVCPDVEGDQPEGTDCNPVVPPIDVCPDVEGNQPADTDCNPVVPPVEPPVTPPVTPPLTPPATPTPEPTFPPIPEPKVTPKPEPKGEISTPIKTKAPRTAIPDVVTAPVSDVGVLPATGGFSESKMWAGIALVIGGCAVVFYLALARAAGRKRPVQE